MTAALPSFTMLDYQVFFVDKILYAFIDHLAHDTK